MKANLYSLILFFFLLACTPANAQPARIVVTSYYDVNDYHFSSRINRFHKSYTAFTYYAPVYTDTYWYSYQPYSWGVSNYGGNGYLYSYPVYTSGYYDGWYDPYYGYSYNRGYQPAYYRWYSPVIVSINAGNHRHNSYYWSGHKYNYNNTGNVYNTTNNYYYSSPTTRSRTSGYTNTSFNRRASTPVSTTTSVRRDPDNSFARTPANRTNVSRATDPDRDGNTGNVRNSAGHGNGNKAVPGTHSSNRTRSRTSGTTVGKRSSSASKSSETESKSRSSSRNTSSSARRK